MMSGIITLREASREVLKIAPEAVFGRFGAAIRPIYRNKGSRPEHLGTATFIELEGRDYVLTAGHVVDNHEKHSLFIGAGGLQPVNLTFSTTVPPSQGRNRDR